MREEEGEEHVGGDGGAEDGERGDRSADVGGGRRASFAVEARLDGALGGAAIAIVGVGVIARVVDPDAVPTNFVALPIESDGVAEHRAGRTGGGRSDVGRGTEGASSPIEVVAGGDIARGAHGGGRRAEQAVGVGAGLTEAREGVGVEARGGTGGEALGVVVEERGGAEVAGGGVGAGLAVGETG